MIRWDVGITGNHYVWGDDKLAIENIAKEIGKSINSVYWNKKFGVWVIRVKRKSQKILLKEKFTK